ncbi:hypothetical protein SAY86_021580 [Trapa natans]|uniref:ATP synthase F1 complex delta/epsilon subunit N-terminal domain-containing protein n=1 Tax=Trapa natans TaxID=22666 RepID=A0AAN7RLT4_TRANT|nr:hypothetical protein SAY86_021580 [Trapa natans]
MLRQATRFISRFVISIRFSIKPSSTDVPAASTTDTAFIDSWKKVIPNMEPPKTPSFFSSPRPSTPSTIPTKITINFVLPYASELANKEVDMVIIPATTGQMGALPGHVPTIAELKPGP